MRLVLQRVDEASVSVGERTIAAIGRGYLVLVGVEKGDGERDARRAAEKVWTLRVFGDQNGKMNLPLAAVGGQVLAVSQFTLAGSIDKGRRPGFDRAMEPESARLCFDQFVSHLSASGATVQTGAFGEEMKVRLTNDGPVTFTYDTRRLTRREPDDDA